MSDSIKLHESKMREMFRVYEVFENGSKRMLMSTPNGDSAEKLCRAYDGHAPELRIEKVWIQR